MQSIDQKLHEIIELLRELRDLAGAKVVKARAGAIDLMDRDVDRVLARIANSPGGVTRTQINRGLFGGRRSPKEIDRILARLLERGLIRCETEATRGRTRTIWKGTSEEARRAISDANGRRHSP